MTTSKTSSPKMRLRWIIPLLGMAATFCAGFWVALYVLGVDSFSLGSSETPDATTENPPEAGTQELVPAEEHPGRWHYFRDPKVETRVRDQQDELRDEILSLGYLDGSSPAPASSEVTVYKKGVAYDGVNLYSSGHAPEAFLIDMNGKVLHAWQREFKSVWPNFGETDPIIRGEHHWRRVHLFPNGDLLAIFEGLGLVKLDKDSDVIWSYGGRAHHDLVVQDNGEIFVLTREMSIVSWVNPSKQSDVDYVVVLDANGKELRKFSLLDCFNQSPYRVLLERMPFEGDLFHTNTLEVFDGQFAERSSIFAQGNILTSIWQLDTIAIVDPSKQRVVWAMNGMWRKQHQPTLLDNGNMLIFDNLGNNERSRVIEFNPLTQEIAWSYEGNPPDAFLSQTCGSCQRLPNGNTLITESDNGRAFEVTPEREIAWQFVNPHRAGEKDELIATLFELIRLGPDFPVSWASGPPTQAVQKTASDSSASTHPGKVQ